MKGFGRWWIPGFLLCVFVASCIPTLCPSALGKDEYPDCNWKCSAKNAAVENVWVETIGDSCVPGSPIVASVYLTFNNKSGSTLYALRCLGDFYVDGDLEVSIDECVGDASPGVTTLLLASVAIDCSSDIELRDVVVSWSPRDETCGDEPSCPGRATQCWSADVIDVIPEYLYVDFDFDSPVCLGEPIAFFSTTSGGEEPYAYSWDFGDGAGASSAENPTYTYAAPGTYTVSLTVVDDDGTTNTALHDDDVTEPPFAEASNAGPYCPGDTIELFAEGGLFYEWSGPDGFVSSDQNPIILNATASDAGTYTVTVYDNLDCQATASTQVVMDATAPMLVVPTDVTIECDDPRDPAGTGEATATDDVDPFPTIDYADALDLSSCGGSAGTITRTWTATDDCGNSVSKTQTITIVDTTPPSLSISSAQFECDGSGNTTDITAWLASAVATDTCSTVTVTNDYAGLSGACPDIGSVEVTFTATDACANAATRTATLAVVDTAAPNVVNDSAATDEDLAVLIDVLANDSDTCDPSPALASVGTPSVGTAGIVGGQVRYTPPPGYNGTTIFSYTIEDCSVNAASALVEVTVTPVNDPPVVNDQALTAQEDTPLPITVTATDPDGDPLTYSILSGPSNGTISGFDPATGGLTYTPEENYNGPDTFTFEACDPDGLCNTATVTITVEPVDDSPVADPQDLTTPEDTPLPITVTGSDVDGDPITYGIVSGPSNGTINGFDPATGQLTYTPDENYHGPDSFVFEACDPDPGHGCAQAAVAITVTPVNDPPVANDQSRVTPEDTATGFFALSVSDPDNTLAEIVCDCLIPPAHGTVVRGPNHTVNYTPNTDFAGIDTFTYEVCDSEGLCDTATVTITVSGANDNPVVSASDQTTPEDTPITFAVDHSDPDDDSLSCTASDPAHGSILPAAGTVSPPYPATEMLTYTPDTGFSGVDQVVITCEDGQGGSDSVTVEIIVIPVNDPPIANDESGTVQEDTPLPITVTATDPDGDTLAYMILSEPTNGTISGFDPDTGDLLYTPNANYHGPDSFTFEACDPSGACDTGVVTITVEPVDDLPVATPQDLTTPEDTPLAIGLIGSDADVGEPINFGIVSGPTNGTIRGFDADTGELIYTPNENYHGSDSFTFEVCDPHTWHGCAQATVTITITPVNDPPVAQDQSRTTSEDTETGFFSLLIADLDNTLAEIVCDCQVPPSHGTVVRGPDHTVNYIPNPGFSGQDTFSYEICDSVGACDTAFVTVDVLPVDDPPVARDDAVGVAEDGSVVIDVPANDSDPDGDLDATSVVVLTQPAHGDVTVDPVIGEITYDPDANFTGTDTFSYEICDSQGACDTATVTVEVNPVDDPPVANDDTASVAEDGTVTIDVPDNDSDPDGDLDVTTVSIVSQPSNGTVSVDPVTGEITYEPNDDFSGTDTFSYQICDSVNVCDTATVEVNVIPVDDPPVANDDSTSTPEDVAVVIDVPANDYDVDDNLDRTTVTITSQPSNGTVSVDPATGEATYTPETDFHGSETFGYQICDTDGLCDVAEVTVNVGPEDDPPVARDDTGTVFEDGVTTVDVVANDSDPDGNLDPTSVLVTLPPAHGDVTVDPVTGEITYAPDANYHGADSFNYQVCDSDGECGVATVRIDVVPVDDPPEANDDGASVAEDGSVVIDVVDNDSDPDGDLDATSVSVLTQPAHGTVTVDPVTGEITYEPDPNFNGTDTFDYRICDSLGVCDTAEVTVNVYPVDDLPVATPQDLTTPEDEALSIGLIGSDADGDPLTYNILSGPSNGTISGFDANSGELIYTPNEDYHGPDSFTFEVCDPHPNECGTAEVRITVTPVNDPPVAGDDTTQLAEDGTVTIDVPDNDSDPDGDLEITSVTIVSQPSSGTVTIDTATG